MTGVERVIVVIDDSSSRAAKLKALIEFMDAPAVLTASPADWTARVGDKRLAAVFVNEDLPDADMSRLLEGIREVDPNTPIVMVNGEQHA